MSVNLAVMARQSEFDQPISRIVSVTSVNFGLQSVTLDALLDDADLVVCGDAVVCGMRSSVLQAASPAGFPNTGVEAAPRGRDLLKLVIAELTGC